MKRILLILLSFYALCIAKATTMPQIDGRLRVCFQNCQYFYVLNYQKPTALTDYHTYDSLVLKTNKIVNSFLAIDADIYALEEVEENDSVLSFLTIAMNNQVGYDKYAFVRDGLGPYDSTKGGFVYNKTTVQPYGNDVAGTTEKGAYQYRNRIQAFTEIATNERLVVSVNHFKSKRGDTTGATQATRNDNAQGVINKLKQSSITRLDPDQLVVGDLNETTSEPAVQMLINAGYTEQLERFNSSAYSYYYSGNTLLDHILANASMATQIVDADVYHINTDNYSGWYKSTYRYSDHDPVIVGINLGLSTGLENVNVMVHGTSSNCILFDLQGRRVERSGSLPAGIYIMVSNGKAQKIFVK